MNSTVGCHNDVRERWAPWQNPWNIFYGRHHAHQFILTIICIRIPLTQICLKSHIGASFMIWEPSVEMKDLKTDLTLPDSNASWELRSLMELLWIKFLILRSSLHTCFYQMCWKESEITLSFEVAADMRLLRKITKFGHLGLQACWTDGLLSLTHECKCPTYKMWSGV